MTQRPAQTVTSGTSAESSGGVASVRAARRRHRRLPLVVLSSWCGKGVQAHVGQAPLRPFGRGQALGSPTVTQGWLLAHRARGVAGLQTATRGLRRVIWRHTQRFLRGQSVVNVQ
jgi:hypothetical protein